MEEVQMFCASPLIYWRNV